MDARLSAIAALVRLDRKICDVGTDHALLPCLLYRRGAREIVACDVNEGPLKAAREAVLRAGAGDAIRVIKSDGLREVPPCDDVIVAGMGGELIARIVTECRFPTPDTRFILQPMTRAETLRRELYRAGFEILLENGVSAGGRVYTVLLVRYTGEIAEIGDGFAFFGKNTDPRYIASVNRRLKRLAEGDPYYRTLIKGENETGKDERTMTTVGEIYDFIDTFAPFGTQDEFDNSGLLVGDGGDPVTKAAVCLDITNDVIAEARAAGAELIVSHHPVIFHRPKRIGRGSPVYRLIESGIDALCVHTPIDMARDGISDLMLRRMDLPTENAEVLHMIRPAEGIGYGKIVRLDEETTAAALAERAKAAFGCPFVRYADGGKPIRTAAVCSGAGNDEIYTAIEKGADALVTGDVKHHGFIDAKNAGLTVIDAGHYHTEIIVCEPLMKRLSDRFPEVSFFIPAASADCCKTC